MKHKILLDKTIKETDALIITNDINRYFFSGVKSSYGVFLLANKKAYLLVDFRYFEIAKKTCYDGINVILIKDIFKDILNLLNENNCKTVMLEYSDISLSLYNSYKSRLQENNIIKVIENDFLDKTIKEIRMIKSDDEIENIRVAQKMTDETFSYILNKISVGMTEKQIALDMEFFMRKLGSDGVSFPFIVLSGKNTSLPHGEPSDKKVESGDFLLMDFGAVYKGYHSDMTRTIGVNSLNNEQKDIYNIVLNAQKTAINNISANKKCKDIDKIARDIIYNNGFTGCFSHSLGHSLGLEIHEEPRFSEKCDVTLKNNMILTVEPGIYLSDRYGVRIEDTIIVNDNSCVNLTKSDKKLIII